MKYTKQQRLEIGRRIYDGEINRFIAAELYNVSPSTARDYMRLYRHENGLPEKKHNCQTRFVGTAISPLPVSDKEQKDMESMSREELIRELVLARINEARLKKGYQVKGVGASKEYIPLDNKNTK